MTCVLIVKPQVKLNPLISLTYRTRSRAYPIFPLVSTRYFNSYTQLDPQWACANFGTLLCIECSGIHRSLGVHVSKVRSLSLDKWEPEAIEVMLRLGNTMTNKIFEANITSASGVPIANPASDRYERRREINMYNGIDNKENDIENVL